MAILQPWIAALALAITLFQSPDDLLRRSDVGAFAPASFRARLVLRSQPKNARHEIEVWRSGSTRTLVRLLGAKDQGKYLLRIDDQMWLLTPGAKKPVRLGPNYRLYGGATLDEVLGVRLAQQYEVESSSRVGGPEGAVVVFELRAKTAGMLFPRVRYVVREATERPVSATYLLRSGREATSVEFVEWSTGRLAFARRLVVKDLLRKGELTEVEVVEMEERAVPDGLFSLDDQSARRSLEAASKPR